MPKLPHPTLPKRNAADAALERATLALQMGSPGEAERLADGVLRANRSHSAAAVILGSGAVDAEPAARSHHAAGAGGAAQRRSENRDTVGRSSRRRRAARRGAGAIEQDHRETSAVSAGVSRICRSAGQGRAVGRGDCGGRSRPATRARCRRTEGRSRAALPRPQRPGLRPQAIFRGARRGTGTAGHSGGAGAGDGVRRRVWGGCGHLSACPRAAA